VTWVRGAAIRPVPAYAVVPPATLASVERELARDEDKAQRDLDRAFRRFEATQPTLANRMGDILAKPIDETALALGYFLSIAIWLAFDRAFSGRLEEVTEDALHATEAALTLEEELRASHADEPLELDDVVAMEQPGVLAFVHEHVEAALDPQGPRRGRGREGADAGDLGDVDARDAVGGGDTADEEVDVDDVHLVYRAILVLTLALSHAVVPKSGPRGTTELLA
jgi:hypothetical protein